MLIELEDERSLAMEGVSRTSGSEYVDDPEPYYQTQYKILQGRDLAARAARKLEEEGRIVLVRGGGGDFL